MAKAGERSRARSFIKINPLLLALAPLALGAAVRARFVLSASFPLNDGGLFYVMMHDLARAGFRLPETTSYNSAGIPFAYPPLGLYLGALLTKLTPIGPIDVLRFVPLAISIVTIGAFFLLAGSVLSSKPAQLAATTGFALLPRSFVWMIMGGGLTRSLGLLFAILALQQLYVTYTRPTRRSVLLAIVFGGMTLLSHTEFSWFLLCSAVVMFLAHLRHRATWTHTIPIGLGAALLAAPWWATVVARHGIGVFLDAGGSRDFFSGSSQLIQAGPFNLADERLFPMLSLLGLSGMAACISQRKFFLPAWLVVAMLSAPWESATMATVPLALLAGIGVTQVMLPLIEKMSARAFAPTARRSGAPAWPQVAVLTVMVCFGLFAATTAAPVTLSALPRDERDAMHWVAEYTPPASRYLIITGEYHWRDRTSEWFPALTDRVSVATPQGLEWVDDRYDERVQAHDMAQQCAVRGADCLGQWSTETGISFAYVYVSKRARAQGKLDFDDCCEMLRSSLRYDPAYLEIYDGPGATVFVRR